MSWWFSAFALSLIVEVPTYLTLLKTPARERWFAAVGTTVLTHPYAWFVFPSLLTPHVGYWGYVAITEMLVVLVEAAVCLGLGSTWRRALLAAVVANTLSFAAGWLLLPSG